LRREHVGLDPDGFTLTIPPDVRSGEYQYLVAFECGRAATCPSGTFHVPVKNDADPVLEVKAKSQGLIPAWQRENVLALEFKTTSSSYDVRKVALVVDPELQRYGIGSIDFLQYDRKKQPEHVPAIETVRAGGRHSQYLRVRRADFWTTTWANLAADWQDRVPEAQLGFEFVDRYERRWETKSPPIKLTYMVPWYGRVAYCVLLLTMATIAGTIGRLVVARMTVKLKCEARAWLHSLLLALVLWLLAVVLRARFEPAGMFQLEFTTMRGIIMTGLLAGLVPELIQGRIAGMLPKPAPSGQAASPPPAQTSSPASSHAPASAQASASFRVAAPS
jgi:hypothetical protein